MTEPLQVGQFAIVDHEPVERGPNAGIFTGRGPAGDRPELYLLAEGTTPAGEAFAGHVVSEAGQHWASFDMSVTGALKRVFEDADASLRDWNRKSIAQHRVRLGLAAFMRRGTQSVLAQAGPSAAFHVSRRGVDAYYTDEEHAAPLGTGEAVAPQFRRIDFAPGDRLLLISTPALRELDDDVISGILKLPPEQVLQNIFRRVRGLRDVTAVLLAHRAAPASAVREAGPDFVIGAGQAGASDGEPGFQPSLFITERAEDDIDLARRQLVAVSERVRMTTAVLPSAMHPVSVPEPLRRVASGEVAPSMRSRASLAGVGAVPRQLPVATTPAPGRRDASFSRALSGRRAAPPPPPLAPHARPVSELANDRRAEQRTVVPFTETLVTEPGQPTVSTPLVRVREEPSTRFRGGGALGRRQWPSFKAHPPTWLIALGGITVLLLVVAVLAGPRLLSGDDDDRFLSLIEGAEQNLATAQVVQDAAARRTALTTAHGMLLEAQELAPESSEVARHLLAVEEGLNELDAVRAPALVETIASLEQFGATPVTPDSLVVMADGAYVLDSASGQLIRVPFDGSLPTARYTMDTAAGRGRPVAVAEYDSANLGGPFVLIADTERGLWAVNSTDSAKLRFDVTGAVTDIAVWDGDLYVLDTPAKTVYRLSPADGGFSNPVAILQSEDLGSAARLTVNGEEVYTADQQGTVHFFAGSLALAMSAAGIDTPLSSARRPWITGENGELAVLDPAHDRIVVLRPDGTFSHQFRHPDFATSSAYAMEEGRGFIFSGGQLRVVTFTQE